MPAAVETLAAIRDFLLTPWLTADWGAWRDFWLQRVFDDRFLVCYFAPLLPVLLVLRGVALRVGIVLTCLTFLTGVFGAYYAASWLLMCVCFYYIGEYFAERCRLPTTGRWWPVIFGSVIIAGWFLITRALQHVELSDRFNDWLWHNAKWVFPLGTRGLDSEPFWAFSPRPQSVAPFQLLQAAFFQPHLIGTAYFTVRMLHYFAELRRNTIPRERRSLLRFLSFSCFAPTLMQGPIERYPRFQDEIDVCHERRGWGNVIPAVLRIAWGLTKCLMSTFYFVPVLWHELGIGRDGADCTYYAAPERIGSYALLYFGVYLQIYALYLEFSGYCDVAAGFSRLLGYRLVENFDWPWLATSLRDFWRRWHISLSTLLRDYLYIPFGGNRRHVTLNLCATFALCGLWHVPWLQMGLWGVLMGAMLAVNQHWVHFVKRADETGVGLFARVRRAWLRLRPLPQVCAWALTMHCFVMSLLLFFGGTGGVRVAYELVRRPLAAIGSLLAAS